MQKLKKSIDFLKKLYILKIGSRSAKFKRLAETQNICVVYENEPSIKKLIVRTKISVENKKYMCPMPGKNWESA